MGEIVIASACRTAIGTFGGTLKDVPAAELGAIVVKEAVKRAGIKRGIGNTDVLIEIQEPLMERQQSKFQFPDYLYSASCFFESQRFCSGNCMVHLAVTSHRKA